MQFFIRDCFRHSAHEKKPVRIFRRVNSPGGSFSASSMVFKSLGNGFGPLCCYSTSWCLFPSTNGSVGTRNLLALRTNSSFGVQGLSHLDPHLRRQVNVEGVRCSCAPEQRFRSARRLRSVREPGSRGGAGAVRCEPLGHPAGHPGVIFLPG